MLIFVETRVRALLVLRTPSFASLASLLWAETRNDDETIGRVEVLVHLVPLPGLRDVIQIQGV
jgi:hypothetical protein